MTTIEIFPDGDQYCAKIQDLDIQESPTGFGTTETEALEAFVLDWKGVA